MLALRELLASNGHGLVEFRLALYRGELLEGLEVRDPSFDEWVSGERERLSAALGRWLQRSLDYSLELKLGSRWSRRPGRCWPWMLPMRRRTGR